MIKARFAVITAVFLSISVLFFASVNSQVSAAPARCFVATVAGGGFASCAEPLIKAAFERQAWAPLDNHCYIFDGSKVEDDASCSSPLANKARCIVSAGIYGAGEVSCDEPTIKAAFAAKGWQALSQHCYIYEPSNLQDVGCTHPAFGKAVEPSQPQPGGNGNNNSGQSPVEQGSAPGANNAEEADPAKPPVDRKDNAGFDEVDASCNVGTQGQSCSITNKLNAIANILSAGVGVIIVIVIIVGGIQYASAGGDAGKVAAAKARISNAIYALIAFFFLYAFLQWLVPGGIF